MAKFVINGGKKLQGEVTVSGNKNSTFPLMAAALLGNSPTTLTNVPKIKDAQILCDILRELGCLVTDDGQGTVTIDPRTLSKSEISSELGGKLRGAIVLSAALLAKFKKAEFPQPGGDPIGVRPLGAHIDAMAAFGAECDRNFSGVSLTAVKLSPAKIFLEEASVTATEMAMILASAIPGETTLEDAACEPHVVDTAEMLIKMGADITGVGTNTLKIIGSSNLKGVEHKVRPDHIEVGTFAIASAITQGNIKIHDAIPQDLKMILVYLSRMGVSYKFVNETVLEISPSPLKASQRSFQTRPWPGFPTDMMSQFIILATQTEGTVLCHDWMYESRMYFVDRLIRMGANIMLADPHRAIVVGPRKLHGDLIPTADIRAGGALVLAGLVAQGETIVEHAEIIDRGYEEFDKKLEALGADIKRVE